MPLSSNPVESRPELSRDEVLAKCAYFTKVQLWPTEQHLDPIGWLSNFRAAETPHAIHLLNAFSYFSGTLVSQMFASSFQSLSRHVAKPTDPLITLSSNWRTFIDRAVITYVTGEVESPTDSGHIFARLCRNYLGIQEEQICTPQATLQLLADRGPRPIIFVDDFIGSGNQFVETWKRLYPLNGGAHLSFLAASSIGTFPVFYASVFATTIGLAWIRNQCPEVRLSVAHEIDARYSLLHPDCPFWPKSLRATAVDFLRTVSARAQMPDTNGASVDDWQGFHKLGLALAFEHGTPDATLGLLRWQGAGWLPLRRTQ